MSESEVPGLERAILERGFDWKAGVTSLSALPPEEQDRRLGLRLIPEEMERLAIKRAMPQPREFVSFPPAWDWRSAGGADWTTAIRDQKSCGSCVAFGTVGVLETMLKRHEANASLQPDLSEAHLFFCGCGNCCDSGWWPSYALDYAKNQGVPEETCFPYQDHDMPCSSTCSDWQGRALKVTEWREIFDHGQRKEWLATTGPMIGCMAVYRDFFSYRSGVYRHTTGDLAGYHAICVVGYSEADQAWICKNSWGSSWGDNGWFRIGYGECDIDAQFPMYGVAGVVPGQGPGPEPEPEPGGCNIIAAIIKALVR
jgi:C1A family cysteine protease